MYYKLYTYCRYPTFAVGMFSFTYAKSLNVDKKMKEFKLCCKSSIFKSVWQNYNTVLCKKV